MVGMLVGDQHGVEAVDVAFDGREAGEGFALAEAGVNEDAGGFGFEQRDVARTARGEDGDAQTDGASSKCGPVKSLFALEQTNVKNDGRARLTRQRRRNRRGGKRDGEACPLQ